ncbi:hypothetical protein SAY87_014147 [Trapa incisa]|uniref:Nucleotidyl transferase domain-containing protein n=1 Tax=Trapa incisa TaxID=236973 RepID=A0AAN7JD59_9MYRT|nr:hypothetical protein SAY87_014147 [Trapa incisa]
MACFFSTAIFDIVVTAMKRKKLARRRLGGKKRHGFFWPGNLMLKLQQSLIALQDRSFQGRIPSKPPRPKLLKPVITSSLQQQSSHLCPPVSQSVAEVVFGDGHSGLRRSSLYPLTKRRSEGAVPIAANYRLIDVVVSNCINSNITKIYALTQFNSTSLNTHLTKAYSEIGLGKDGFVQAIAAYQSPENQGWFQGNADAVRRCLWVLEEYPVMDFLILPGHHLYEMDYRALVGAHRKAGCYISVVALSADGAHDRNPALGTLRINSQKRVLGIDSNEVKITGKSETAGCNNHLISTRIYLIKRNVLVELLRERFPGENWIEGVIRGAISLGMEVEAYLFDGYWGDTGSIGAFYWANMENTTKPDARFDFYDRDSPVYTVARSLAPSIISGSVITGSLIGDGCILNRCNIKGSVVGMRTRVDDGATVEDSVIMGSDTYEWDNHTDPVNGKRSAAVPPLGIGANTHIRRSIVDKNPRIGKNVLLINRDNVREGDREADGYMISDGIIVVLRNAVIPDGTDL